MTNNLHRRITEHRNEEGSIFSRKYKIRKLVYYEFGGSIEQAILREKQIKAGSRKKKIELIESLNPDWNDLFEGLF